LLSAEMPAVLSEHLPVLFTGGFLIGIERDSAVLAD
jgi:hypothetical protein